MCSFLNCLFHTRYISHVHTVVYFDQLSGACSTWKLVELLKINQKRRFWGTPSGSRPPFACRPALRSRQKHFFCSFSDIFQWFHAGNHWKRFKINKKRLKTAEKRSSTSLKNTQQLKLFYDDDVLSVFQYWWEERYN